jgi:hypothetical protein
LPEAHYQLTIDMDTQIEVLGVVVHGSAYHLYSQIPT